MKRSNRMKRLFSYVIVGGVATLVEWGAYFLLDPVLGLNTYLAIVLSYIISTFANWVVGRLLTFRHAEKKSLLLELIQIYAVSVIGLGMNELIMYLMLNFVLPRPASDFGKLCSKVLATAIVFSWNYLIRNRVIYKEKQNEKSKN